MNIKRIASLYIVGLCLYIFPTIAQEKSYFFHTVAKGESLYSLAQTYNLSIEDITRLNPGSETQINIGSVLKIPQHSSSNLTKPSFHTIEAGETIYRITQMYGVTAEALLEANPGISTQNFKAGQVITIPTRTISSVTTTATTSFPTPQEPKKQSWREMHKVEKGETVFSIAKLYNITVEELLAENTDINADKLKKGTFLFIPDKQQKKASAQTIVVATPSNEELLNKNKLVPTQYQSLNVAVLLPFMTSGYENQSEQMRMLEFYRGFLLAVDSIKSQGYSINLYTYDTKEEAGSIESILSKLEMKRMHIIFGTVGNDETNKVAAFAKANKIRFVVPFSQRVDPVFNSPYLYQINTPQSYLYSEVYEHFVRKFPQANVIFIDTPAEREKAEFVRGLKNELKKQGISYKDITLEENLKPSSLIALMNDKAKNIFIPTSGNYKTLANLMPVLITIREELPVADMALFGYPEWQTYTKDFGNNFFLLNTFFYTSFYTNNIFPDAVRYAQNFKHWYKKDLAHTFPKYGMLGFDIGYYFLKGLTKFGSSMESSLPQVQTTAIQTGFKFERVNNWGGFINKKVFFINFTPQQELIKLDFD